MVLVWKWTQGLHMTTDYIFKENYVQKIKKKIPEIQARKDVQNGDETSDDKAANILF